MRPLGGFVAVARNRPRLASVRMRPVITEKIGRRPLPHPTRKLPSTLRPASSYVLGPSP
jgi:hypothetical protein